MAVSKRLRYEVLRRDDFACRYCGGRAPDVELTVDHVTPKALGGADQPDNLVACCRDCNSGKSSATPDTAMIAQVADDALRWAAAMKQALGEMAVRSEMDSGAIAIFDENWQRWDWFGPLGDTGKAPLPPEWHESIRQFLRAGLTIDLIVELIDVAMGRCETAGPVWRYFCGCCWRRIEDLQRRSAEILREGRGD